MEREKLIEKMAKVKRHMESAAAIGNEAEAQAFAGMLQQMLIKHKLEMTDVEYATEMKEEPIIEDAMDSVVVKDEAPKRVFGSVNELAAVTWKELPSSVRSFIIREDYDCRTAEQLAALYDSLTPGPADKGYHAADYEEGSRYYFLRREFGVGDRDFPSDKWQRYSRPRHVYEEYPDVEIRRRRIPWIEDLAGYVARAYSCEILVCEGSSKIWFVGHKSNVAIVEYLFITLHRAAENLATRAYDERWKELRRTGEPVQRARGFRNSFLEGFVSRILERLHEELRKAEDQGSGVALLRINKEAIAVRQHLDNHKSKKTADGLGGLGSFNSEGYKRGKKAANDMDLTGKAVKQGRPNQQLEE